MINEGEKVSVLLAEYNTLRAEIMTTRSAVFQAASLAAGVLMGLFGLSYTVSVPIPSSAIVSIIVIASIYLFATIVWNELTTHNCAKRLRALEKAINDRAGENLLAWETKFGGAVSSSESGEPRRKTLLRTLETNGS